MSPKPSTVSTAVGSVVLAFTSRRARLARQIAVTAVSVSDGSVLFATVTCTVAADEPQLPVSQPGMQLLTFTAKVSTVPTATSSGMVSVTTPAAGVTVGSANGSNVCGV